MRSNDSPGISTSLSVWRRIAAAFLAGGTGESLVEELPVAGHAAVGLDGITIWAAGATVGAAHRSISRLPPQPAAAYVDAVLRPYQRAGVSWMQHAAAHGLGAILADEMGLGKTVQAIALLAGRSHGLHLVICPTSVLSNWSRELARFAPQVPVIRHTGSDRRAAFDDLPSGSVVLSTYGLLRTDGALARTEWDVVVLDEAQQIKNPTSRAARAAYALKARLPLAMTGTPVENRLEELWSIMAFTNPGLLGNRMRFRQRFIVPIQDREAGAAARRLHEIVTPHILRRRKADVAKELPARIESTVICVMSDEQEMLYRDALTKAFEAGLGAGFERSGRVLALLTRLKQICNHPELVRPTGGSLVGRSGKLDRATEMLTEIIDNDDRALVFTQYRATGELLSRHLRRLVTRTAVPFLHGGLSMKVRDQMVARFSDDANGPPILILSLRAAGFGLNLTRATHVLHYDRWWNPAVEQQASDRAHRIGQTRTVNVYALLTERTLEGVIAEMHDGKKDLAETVATGRAIPSDIDLATLSDQQLRALLETRPGTQP